MNDMSLCIDFSLVNCHDFRGPGVIIRAPSVGCFKETLEVGSLIYREAEDVVPVIYIEDICFFEVNTKYISSSELKTSEFSECAARVKIFMFSTHEMKYIWYSPKKSKFSFYFMQYTGIFQFTRQAVKMQKTKIFENTNNFGTTLFLTF